MPPFRADFVADYEAGLQADAALAAWFDVSTFTPTSGSVAATWSNRVPGSAALATTSGTVALGDDTSSNGAYCHMYYASGTAANSSINFGVSHASQTEFTQCTVARYATASLQNRIFEADVGDFAHGHAAGNVGVAKYNGCVSAASRVVPCSLSC